MCTDERVEKKVKLAKSVNTNSPSLMIEPRTWIHGEQDSTPGEPESRRQSPVFSSASFREMTSMPAARTLVPARPPSECR